MARHNPEEDRRREISRKNSVKKVRKKTGGPDDTAFKRGAAGAAVGRELRVGAGVAARFRAQLAAPPAGGITRPSGPIPPLGTELGGPRNPKPRIPTLASGRASVAKKTAPPEKVPARPDLIGQGPLASGQVRAAPTAAPVVLGPEERVAQPGDTQLADLGLEQVRVGARIRELRRQLQIGLQRPGFGASEERASLGNQIAELRGLQSNIATATREPIGTDDKFDADRIKQVAGLREKAISLLQGQAAAEAQTAEGIFAGGTLGARQSGLRLDPDGAARLFATASPEERARAGGLVVERAGAANFPATEDIRGAVGRESDIRGRIAALEAAPPVTQSEFTTAQREAVNRGIEARRGDAETRAREGVAEQAQIRGLQEQQLTNARLALEAQGATFERQITTGGLDPEQQVREVEAQTKIREIEAREARRITRETGGGISIAEAEDTIQIDNAALQFGGITPDFANEVKSFVDRTVDRTLQDSSRVRNGVVGTAIGRESDALAALESFETSIIGRLDRVAQISPQQAARLAREVLIDFPSPGPNGTFRASRLTVASETKLATRLTTTYQRLLAIANAG